MRTMTAAEITELHAARTAKGGGYAPSLAECLDAARAGRLYDVDTQSAGCDGLDIGDDAHDVIASWADSCDAHGVSRGWSAERITLVETRWFLRRRRGERSVWMTAEELGLGRRDADRCERHLRGFDGSGLPADAYDAMEGAGTSVYTLPSLDGGEPLVCSELGMYSRADYTVMRGALVMEGVYRGDVRPTSSRESIVRGYGHHHGVGGES